MQLKQRILQDWNTGPDSEMVEMQRKNSDKQINTGCPIINDNFMYKPKFYELNFLRKKTPQNVSLLVRFQQIQNTHKNRGGKTAQESK